MELRALTFEIAPRRAGAWWGPPGRLTAGVDSRIQVGLEATGAVLLRDRARIEGNVRSGSTVTQQSGVTVTGTITQNTSVPPVTIPTKTVTPGTADVAVNGGQTLTLAPGSYRDLNAAAGSTLALRAGNYSFRRLILNAGVSSLVLDVSSGPINVDVAGELQIGDRTPARLVGGTTAAAVRFYTNQTVQLRLGTDAVIVGVLTAPNAEIVVSSRTEMRGAVFGLRVIIDADGRVAPRVPPATPPNPGEGSPPRIGPPPRWPARR